MNATTFSLYIIGLLLLTNLLGFIYSLLVVYTKVFDRFKIQFKGYRQGLFWKRMPRYSANFLLLLLFSGSGAYFMFPLLESELINPLWIGIQVLIAFLVDDMFFYFYHRALHENKFLLGRIHSIHHRASPPFPLEYLYAHPLEWMCGTLGVVMGFFVVAIFMPVNVFAILIFGALRNLHEIHIHSDLDIPILSQIPGISKTKHHDDHHSFLAGNYASTFVWWDRLFKTEIKETK